MDCAHRWTVGPPVAGSATVWAECAEGCGAEREFPASIAYEDHEYPITASAAYWVERLAWRGRDGWG